MVVAIVPPAPYSPNLRAQVLERFDQCVLARASPAVLSRLYRALGHCESSIQADDGALLLLGCRPLWDRDDETVTVESASGNDIDMRGILVNRAKGVPTPRTVPKVGVVRRDMPR